MTVSTSTAKSGPYAGSGTTGPFTVTFRFLDNSHLRVIRTVGAVETVLALTTDYTVTGAGASSGTVTLVTALAVGQTLTILRNVPATQEADYVVGDAFPAESHEMALDKLTMLVQQNAEIIARTLRLKASSSGVSAELPDPEADKILGWNTSATALKNINAADLATLVAYGTANSDVFTGDGTETVFTLTDNPGSINNLDISVNGATYVPVEDYTWAGGLDVTFITAPPNGSTVLVRYMQGLPQASTLPIRVSNFTGTGAQTSFVLSSAPPNENNTWVYVNGVFQQKNSYSVIGTTLTFSEAPPVTAKIEVNYI